MLAPILQRLKTLRVNRTESPHHIQLSGDDFSAAAVKCTVCLAFCAQREVRLIHAFVFYFFLTDAYVLTVLAFPLSLLERQ